MTLYQVMDEENHLVGEYQYRDKAQYYVEDMTLWFAEHHYHIEVLIFQEAA